MENKALVYLKDIHQSVERIEEYVAYGKFTFEDFLQDFEKQDAVVRRLEIIGEATKRLSEDFKQLYSQIPWKQIAGLRDVLIHEYDEVDMKRVWLVVEEDLPVLKTAIEKILKELGH